MKFLTTKRFVLLLALLCAGMGQAFADDPAGAAPSRTARDYYNEGTKLLGIQKFAEAEIMFQSALATEDSRVQTAALYNIGHTRFDLGIDFLKKGPDAQKVMDQGNAALAAGDHAIQTADAAMATNDMTRLVNAYLEGRGARHQMRDAEKAVAQAMEVFGNTLRKWQRAADDFKSAAELNPADTNALQNAQVVEQAIAKLVDLTRKMREMAGMLASKRGELGKKMSKMKGQMPGFQAPPGGGGGDDDEDDITPGSLAGLKEKATREGGQMQVQISADQAEQILNGLQIDGKRRLPMNGTQEGKPGERNRRNW
jgi:tetratricopeptide (TPR) repeat protein